MKMTKLNILSLSFFFSISISSFAQQDNSVILPTSLNSVVDKAFNKAIQSENKTAFTQSDYKLSVLVDVAGKSVFIENKEVPSKEFIVDVDKEGDYYFLANVLPVSLPTTNNEGYNLEEINVVINGKLVGYLDVKKPQWSIVPIKEVKKIRLSKGKNIILFQSSGIYYPDIDCVQLSQNETNLIQKNIVYDNYVEKLKAETSKAISTRSAFDDSGNFNVFPIYQYTPGSNYSHMSKVPVVYTFYKKFHIDIPGVHTFTTTPVKGDDFNSVNPVMHLFKIDNPHKECWTNDDYTGYHPRIQANLSTGDYYLVVRSYANYGASSDLGREGLVNVYDGANILGEQIPVSGYVLNCGSSYTGALNYFTGNSTGTPKIWFMDSNNMRYTSEEYSYYPPADYYWLDDARLKINHNQANSNIRVLISSVGAWSVYFGNCDAYGGVPDAESKYMTSFTNLKSGDAIRSGQDNTFYNGPAWAGGINTEFIWTNSKWGDPFVWSTWDKYFGNNPARYNGAKNYSRTGGGNAVIAAFSTSNDVSKLTHFAVTKNANMQMHGYQWESKLGSTGRLFHPLNSVSGKLYGNTIAYYYDPSRPMLSSLSNIEENFTLKQSIENGLTIIEGVTLDDAQQNLISLYKQRRTSINELETLYDNWKRCLKASEYLFENNPYKFLDNQEANSLVQYAKDNLEESLIYLVDRMFNIKRDSLDIENAILPVLFCEIAKDKYGNIIENIKEEWNMSNYTKSGEYKFPAPSVFTKKYMKDILNKNYLMNSNSNVRHALKNEENSISFDNDQLFTVTPNPASLSSKVNIGLPKEAQVTIKIINGHGVVIGIPLNNRILNQGKYSYGIDYDKLTIGMNVCILEVDGKIYSRKILKQ